MKKIFFFKAFLICCLSSCNQTEILDEITMAENVIKENPDSALVVLNTIHVERLVSPQIEAKYNLLYTMAEDKCYIVHVDAERINKTVDYYSKYGSVSEKIRSLFYQGRVYKDMDSTEIALTSLLKAYSLSNTTNDYVDKGLICFHIADLYAENFELKYANRYIKEAVHYFTVAHNHINLGLSLNLTARLRMYEGKYLEAISFYSDAINIFAAAQRDDLVITNITAIASLYLQNLSDPNKAYTTIFDMYKTYGIDDIPSLHYPLLSHIYSHLGNKKKAISMISDYIEKNAPDDESRATAYFMKSGYEYELGEYAEAYDNLLKYVNLVDSISLNETNLLLAEVEKKYERKELENTLLNLKRQNKDKMMIICLVLAIIALSGIVIFYQAKRIIIKSRKEKIELETIIERLNEDNKEISELKNKLDALLNENNENEIKLKKVMCDKILYIQKLADITSIYDNNAELFLEKIKTTIINAERDTYFGDLHEVVNDRFYGIVNYLKDKYPTLNEDEINLCCLICFGFDNNQISILFGHKNYNSIFTKRHKVRKKLGINAISLDNYIRELIANLKQKSEESEDLEDAAKSNITIHSNLEPDS